MTVSIKGGGGVINMAPSINGLKVVKFGFDSIDVEYSVSDVELTICRHYIYLNGNKKEITKEVGYESDTNIFKYKITELTKNTAYTIQIEASDGLDSSLSKAIHQKTEDITIYGVRVMENNSNSETCCTYIEEAIGVSPANHTSLGGWEDKYPFNKIRIVGFKNGQVVKEIKKDNKTQYIDGSTVPTDVDVMVEIPKIYWGFTDIENGYELRISDKKFKNSVCYAHTRNGVEKDFIYVGAYLASLDGNKSRSKTNSDPIKYEAMRVHSTFAKNNGNGYEQLTWFTAMLIQILYLIAFKNLNSQSALGRGYVPYNLKQVKTGGTDKKGFIYGESTGKQQMCFLGIEDLWGNYQQYMEGIYINSNYEIHAIKENTSSGNYEKIGRIDKSFSSGYISKTFHNNECGFLIKENKGSSSTFYADYSQAYEGAYGGIDCYLYFANDHQSGDENGIFNIMANTNKSASSDQSSRLCYLG